MAVRYVDVESSRRVGDEAEGVENQCLTMSEIAELELRYDLG